ncbi:Uncharacterised protein [Candidatus Norongarragalina meridionalis]|nr:Uncharacterised protein [Candidatus Norongarragalina meridionalis]
MKPTVFPESKKGKEPLPLEVNLVTPSLYRGKPITLTRSLGIIPHTRSFLLSGIIAKELEGINVSIKHAGNEIILEGNHASKLTYGDLPAAKTLEIAAEGMSWFLKRATSGS